MRPIHPHIHVHSQFYYYKFCWYLYHSQEQKFGSVCGLYKAKQMEHMDVHKKLLTGENLNGSGITFLYII